MKFISQVICLFVGHKPVDKLTEDDMGIYAKYCERCGVKYMGYNLIRFKWVRQCPPPFTSQTEWLAFCDEKEAEFRNVNAVK